MKGKFYLTTAIDYVNSKVHIGHSLEKIQADVLARYYRKMGKEVFFLTGTDENAQKNAIAAEKAKIKVQTFVKENADFAKKTWKALKISFDYFIRTTNKKIHWPGVKKIWKLCQKAGDIYKKKYTGLYCTGCEAFLKEKDLKDGLCPYHLKKPEIVSEENYFFRLSRYQKKLKEIIEKDRLKIIPKERKNEVLQFIESGLEDFSISRPKERMRGWGIPVPDDNSQIIYVWFDALINYLTGIGFGWNDMKFKKFWPADLHIIGKDILRFHAIYWPAMLLSAKINLPKAILVHGFVTVSGQKMSKTLGNIISPQDLIKKYGVDAVRYFFLRETLPFEDVDFTFEKFEKRYHSDLAFGIGNFTKRVLTLAKKLKIKRKRKDKIILSFLKEKEKNYHLAFKKFEFNKALETVFEIVSFGDKFLQKEKPWEMKKNSKKAIENLLFLLEEVANLIEPFLPETSKKIFSGINKNQPIVLFPKLR